MADTALTIRAAAPDAGGAQKPGTAVQGDGKQGLERACSEFEALFINLLLKEMRATVAKAGLTDGGRAEEVYTGLLDSQVSQELAAKGGIGLGGMLYRQLAETSGREDTRPEGASPAAAAANSKDRRP